MKGRSLFLSVHHIAEQQIGLQNRTQELNRKKKKQKTSPNISSVKVTLRQSQAKVTCVTCVGVLLFSIGFIKTYRHTERLVRVSLNATFFLE